MTKWMGVGETPVDVREFYLLPLQIMDSYGDENTSFSKENNPFKLLNMLYFAVTQII